MPLTKSEVLEKDDFEKVEVEVPEWGGSVFVCTMSGIESQAFQDLYQNEDGSARKVNVVEFSEAIVALTVRDADMQLVFDINDRDTLRKKRRDVILRLARTAAELNGFSDEVKGKLQGN